MARASMPLGAFMRNNWITAGCMAAAVSPKTTRDSTSCKGVSNTSKGRWVTTAAAPAKAITRAGP